jgi:hypothetical protein
MQMVPNRDHCRWILSATIKTEYSARCKLKILRLCDKKRQPELIGGWLIALKNVT